MRSVRENMVMDLSYQFTNKEITPWGGMVFLKQFLDKMNFSEQVSCCDFLPQPGSNSDISLYSAIQRIGKPYDLLSLLVPCAVLRKYKR